MDAILHAAPVALVFTDANTGKTVWLSAHAKNLFETTDEDACAFVEGEMFRSEEKRLETLQQLKSNGVIEGRELVFLTASGRHFVASADFGLCRLGEDMLIVSKIEDITQRKQAEADMCHDAEADKLMSNISSKLLDLNIAGASREAVKNLGVYLDVDRITVFPLSGASKRFAEPIIWAQDRTFESLPGLQDTALSDLPWLEAELLAGHTVSVASPEELPPEASAEATFLKRLSIQSIFVSPIRYQGTLIGYAVMETLRAPRQWSAREGDILFQFGNVIGSGLARQEAEKSLRAAKRRAEDTLRDLEGAHAQLIQVEKMANLGDLVAGIAHETSTPLGVAVTTTSTLRAKTNNLKRKLEEAAIRKSDMVDFFEICREGYGILETNLQRAADLIQSFKRVAVDVSSSNVQPVELEEYINHVLMSLRPRTKKFKGVTVEVDCPPELVAILDPGALSQIITNLLMNALIHAFDNDMTSTGQVRIEVSDLEATDEIELRFSDTGKGMPEEVQQKVFEPYFTTRRGQGGSGLGMQIIENLVNDTLHGSIRVESEEGRGTAFVMTFPRETPRKAD